MKNKSKQNKKQQTKQKRKTKKIVTNPLHITGRGAYKAPGLLGAIGKTAGSYFGGPVGGWVGNKLGNWLGDITGLGSYHVKNNSILQGTVPSFGIDPGSVVVSHREFVADIVGSTDFTITQYPINPGLSGLFPWLSLMAQQYEEYELLGMIVEFKTTSANALNSTNTALGTVIMATDYDCSDPAFTNKQQMEAYQYSTSCNPAASMIHPIECAKNQIVLNRLYIRGSVVPSGFDQRFYDMGIMNIATVGMQAAAVIGELWVSYHVKFLKPKLPTPLGASMPYAHIVDNTGTSRGGATQTFPLGTTGGLLRPASTINSQCTGNSFTLPLVGTFCVVSFWNGFSIGTTAVFSRGANITTSSSASLAPFWVSPNNLPSVFVNDTSRLINVAVYTVTNPGTTALNTVTISGLVGMTGASCDILIFSAPSVLSEKPQSLLQRVDGLEKLLAEYEKLRLQADPPPSLLCSEDEEDDEQSVVVSRKDISKLISLTRNT